MSSESKKSVPENFLYHSFARLHREEDESARATRSLNILASICDNGLLLTPERIEFSEPRSDGSTRTRWLAQSRTSFTLLEPPQLLEHSRIFGPISLEWDFQSLQREGVIPVFYVPLHGGGDSGAVGASLLSRLYELQESFRRLSDLKSAAKVEKTSHIHLVDPESGGTSALEVKTVLRMLAFLEQDAVEIEDQFATVRTIAGYFSPTTDPKYSDDKFLYYRQREWRITNMWLRQGTSITQKVSDGQKRALTQIDPQFFSKDIGMLNASGPRIDFCHYLETVGGKRVAESVRRIIAPSKLISQIAALLESRGLRIEIVALETFC